MKIINFITLFSLSFIFSATTISINNTATDVIIELNSDTDIYGIQFDLKYDPSQLSIDPSAIKGTQDAYATKKNDGIVRVLTFDFNGKPIKADNGNQVISIPFIASDKFESSFVEFSGDKIVAGYNGQKIEAEFVNNYVSLDNVLPTETSLSKNYPNPFNPTTTINYSIAKPGNVSIIIYNLNGSAVKTLVNEYANSNNYSVVWDGKNDTGQQVASGQYFYVMQAPGFTSTEYMTLIK